MVDLRPKNIYNTILEIDEYTKIKENKYYESLYLVFPLPY